MKRLIAILLVLTMALSLAACKETDGGTQQPGQSAASGSGERITEVENKVGLSLDASHYEKNSSISVTLDFDKLDQEKAIIVLVDSDAEHSEKAIHDNYVEYRYLADFSELPFYITVPSDADGLFDVRVYANDNGGEELACITIAVGNAALPSGSTNGSGSFVVITNDGAKTYSEAYANYAAVYTAMDDAYYAVLDPHNERIAAENDDYWDDPKHFSDIVRNFVNLDISFTAAFGDGGYQQSVAAMFDLFGMKEAKIEELDASNYKLTYTRVYNDPDTYEAFENAPWEVLCGFDSSGSLYFYSYVTVSGEKMLDSLVEFVPLGGGRYALQSKNERGIVEIANGEAAAYEYAAYNADFNPERDAIFPKAAGADAAWITAGEEMIQHITLTKDNLHIWADEVTDGWLTAPERDITIER